MFDVDLFVIGGGSGGVRAARVAASHGARVAIAEADRWGGTCVIRGCVPKKLLVYASEVSRTLADAPGYGWTIEGARFDWAALIANKDREIARLSARYAENLRQAGATIHEGRAALVERHAIVIDGATRVTAANILIATGGRARRLELGAPERWITSDEAFHLPRLPRRLAIIGGGYVAIEFAHIFAGLGVEVVVVVRGGLPLRGFDPDLRDAAARGLAAHGVQLVTGAEPRRASVAGGELSIELSTGHQLAAELGMWAIGRDPATAGLGAGEVGVALDAGGAIVVDEWSRSSVPHIYAVGDVTGRIALTPVAIREGHAVADTVFGGRPTPITHDLIPSAVFGQPPIAAIGLTEPEAIARGHAVEIYRSAFRPMRFALPDRDERFVIKLVVDRATRRVLGLHLAGVDAPEILQAAAIAVTMGATKEDLDRTFALHPTTAEELVLLRQGS